MEKKRKTDGRWGTAPRQHGAQAPPRPDKGDEQAEGERLMEEALENAGLTMEQEDAAAALTDHFFGIREDRLLTFTFDAVTGYMEMARYIPWDRLDETRDALLRCMRMFVIQKDGLVVLRRKPGGGKKDVVSGYACIAGMPSVMPAKETRRRMQQQPDGTLRLFPDEEYEAPELGLAPFSC